MQNFYNSRAQSATFLGKNSYKNITYFPYFIHAKNAQSYASKYSCASELVEYDKQLIKDTKEQKEQIEKEKVELEENKKELDTSLPKSEQENTKLKGLKKEKETYATQLSQQEKEVQKEIEELQSSLNP